MDVLFLLVTSSLFIIGMVALYLHFAGFSKRSEITDTKAGLQTAKDKVRAAYPNSAIIDFKISPSRTIALTQFRDKSASILHVMGHNWIIHPLEKNSVRRITPIQNAKKGSGLRIKFNDYTAPNLTIYLEDENTSQAWQAQLLPFIQT